MSWIKASERSPKPYVSVLAVIIDLGGEPYMDICILTNGHNWSRGAIDQDGNVHDIPVEVSHWQPLPELPNEETE